MGAMWNTLLTHAALVVTVGGLPASAKRPGDYLRTSAEFRLSSAADIAQLTVQVVDIRTTRPETRQITDLLMRLTADGGAIDTALQLANAPAGARLKPTFRAAIYTVIDGRITRDTDATCDQWRGDVATCRLDCDGGTFALRRSRGALTLLFGTVVGGGDRTRSGFALNACATGDSREWVLAPAGDQPSAELPLSGE